MYKDNDFVKTLSNRELDDAIARIREYLDTHSEPGFISYRNRLLAERSRRIGNRK